MIACASHSILRSLLMMDGPHHTVHHHLPESLHEPVTPAPVIPEVTRPQYGATPQRLYLARTLRSSRPSMMIPRPHEMITQRDS